MLWSFSALLIVPFPMLLFYKLVSSCFLFRFSLFILCSLINFNFYSQATSQLIFKKGSSPIFHFSTTVSSRNWTPVLWGAQVWVNVASSRSLQLSPAIEYLLSKWVFFTIAKGFMGFLHVFPYLQQYWQSSIFQLPFLNKASSKVGLATQYKRSASQLKKHISVDRNTHNACMPALLHAQGKGKYMCDTADKLPLKIGTSFLGLTNVRSVDFFQEQQVVLGYFLYL